MWLGEGSYLQAVRKEGGGIKGQIRDMVCTDECEVLTGFSVVVSVFLTDSKPR